MPASRSALISRSSLIHHDTTMKLFFALSLVAAVSAVKITLQNHEANSCSGEVTSVLITTNKCVKSNTVYVTNNCDNCTSACKLFQYQNADCTGAMAKPPLDINAARGLGSPSFTDGSGFCTGKTRVFCASSGALAAPSMTLLGFALLFSASRLI